MGVTASYPPAELHAVILRDYLVSLDAQCTIAARYGLRRSQVVNVLRFHGIKLRGCAEAGALNWARMTQTQREQQTEACHADVRGRKKDQRYLFRRAQGIESRGALNDNEFFVYLGLMHRGFTCQPQKAFGKYNVDVAISSELVAVDVFGGGWHAAGRHAARYRERCDYILSSGWELIIAWTPLTVGVISTICNRICELQSGITRRETETVMDGAGRVFEACPYNGVRKV